MILLNPFRFGAPAPTFYIDSIGGSDANSGRTSLLPKQTLAATVSASVSGERIALAKGSHWRESLSLGALSNIAVTTYGSGADPIIDGSNIVTGWALASGRTNVYEKSLTHNGSSTARMRVFENGVRLTRVANVATCDTTPGSYVYLKGSDVSPWNVQIHPLGSTIPGSDGKTYEVIVRTTAIRSSGTGFSLSGVHTRRAMDNDGSAISFASAAISRVLAVDGSKHNMLMASGSMTDCIAVRADALTAEEPSQTYFVGYTIDAAGLGHTITRCGCAVDLGGTRFGIAWIQHDSSSHVYSTFTAQQIWAIDNVLAWQPSATNVAIDGYFTNNCVKPISIYAGNALIRYAQIKQGTELGELEVFPIQSGGPSTIAFEDCVFYNTGSNTPLIRPSSSMNGVNLVFRRCVIYHAAFRSTMVANGAAWTSGSITFENCIFVYAANSSTCILCPAGVSYFGNNNVFLCNTNGGTNLNLNYQGTFYDTIATWRAATGQDANSIALGPSDLASLFSGTVANGDFRLGASGAGIAAAAIAAGPQNHWNWNSRAAAAGPPQFWPIPPDTLAKSQTYIANPTLWNFTTGS